MKKLIILFLLLPSLLFSQVSPSKIERIADANTVFGSALSYGTYLVVQSNNKTYKIISVNGVAGTAKLSDLVLNTDYIEEGSVTSVSTAAANNGVTATWSMASPTPALTIGLGAITPTSVNGLTLTPLAIGFTVAGGTTSKTLTVPLDASVSGTNTGDQTNITGNAGSATNLAGGAGGTIPYQSAAGTTVMLANGSAGQVLQSNGTTLAPSWVAAGAGDMILAGAQTVTGSKIFGTSGGAVGKLIIAGSTSGSTILDATPVAGSGTVTLPTTGTLATLAGTEVLTNKDLTSGTNTFPTFNQNTSGNAATVTTNANLTGEVTSVGNATTLGSFTSASLATALTNETGTGVAVFATSPTFVTPALGTPASGVATNLTGTAAGLTAGNVTTNANLTGEVTSVGNSTTLGSFTSASLASALTDETGTGIAVLATSPTFVTPTLGVASATTINKLTLTTPATAATLTVIDGKSLTASNTLTLTGTDGSSVAFGTGGTVTYTADNLGVFAATTSAQLSGVLSDETGTGSAVFATSPTFVTPALGTPASGVATNLTGTAAGLTAGNVTTNADLTGEVISVGNATTLGTFTSTSLATALTDETGTGVAVFATSPSFVTPVLGTPTSGLLNNCTSNTESVNNNSTELATTAYVDTKDQLAIATAGTTTSTTFIDLTGMSITLVAGTYQFDTWIFGQAGTGTNGARFAMNYTGTTTSYEANQSGQLSTTTFGATARVTAVNTASTTLFTTSASEGWVHISGQIVVSDGGDLRARGLKVTSQTLTWRGSSWMQVRRIN